MSFALLTAVYLAAILVVDSHQGILNRFGSLVSMLPVVIALTTLSYFLRFMRWRWLLSRRAHSFPVGVGFLAYVAGFAYTATPGKLGELLRIRYFGHLRVPANWIVCCFIFERLLDLIVLLLLAMMMAKSIPFIGTCLAFVVLVIAIVLAVGSNRKLWVFLARLMRGANYRQIARIIRTLAGGFRQTLGFLNARELSGALSLGLLSWSVQMLAFYAILRSQGASLALTEAVAISSAAMIIGAASMLPGGVGTTETAMVFLLTHHGVLGETALLAAICMRLGTIWFAVLLGLAVAWILERRLTRFGSLETGDSHWGRIVSLGAESRASTSAK
jgi:uncharacterized protein (TIRG00374 family)